jgi:CheY-like chemotaxis protein
MVNSKKIILVVSPHADDYKEPLTLPPQDPSPVFLQCVKNIEEMANYLESSRPHLILLDLQRFANEALMEIKKDDRLRAIPVVVFTEGQTEEEIRKGWLLGAASFLEKPKDPEDFMEIIRVLKQYWLELAELPV